MRRLPLLLALLLCLHAVPSAGAAAGAPTADRDCLRTLAGIDLQTATIPELEQAMAAGQITSLQLVDRYLARIDAYRAYDAVRAVNPDAGEIARRLDAEREAGHVRGPLHGIPVLLKDNVGTKDMPTTAGSIALQGWSPTHDATIAARLREAGAIILGKTNLSEFANWMATGMPNGFSTLGGQVVNAYNGGDPSGSSAGSGVAASLALAAATIGTETSGSILSPSMANSDVGLKTTRGLASRTGIIPLAERFDVPGPMTRTVTDAAAMLTAIAGSDPDDRATDAIPGALANGHDFTQALAPGALQGMVLAYDAGESPSAGSSAGKLYDRALAALRAAGATLVDTDGFDDQGTAGSLAELPAIFPQFHAALDRYLQTTPHQARGAEIRSLADVIAYNAAHADKVPYGQDRLVESFATPGLDAFGEAIADQAIDISHTSIDATLDGAKAVAYVAPDAPYISLGAAAGHPTLVLPLGRPSGTPVAISFLGRRFGEEQLLAAGYAVEQAVKGTRPGAHANRVLPTEVEGGASAPACAAAG